MFQLDDVAPGGFGWGFYTPRRADNLATILPWPGNDGKTTVEIF